jgi:hypothetical protein
VIKYLADILRALRSLHGGVGGVRLVGADGFHAAGHVAMEIDGLGAGGFAEGGPSCRLYRLGLGKDAVLFFFFQHLSKNKKDCGDDGGGGDDDDDDDDEC